MPAQQRTVARHLLAGDLADAVHPVGLRIGQLLARFGFTGGFEPGPNHAVATVPYGGGKATTLVKGGYEPDWSL
jgi:hypothetical protein